MKRAKFIFLVLAIVLTASSMIVVAGCKGKKVRAAKAKPIEISVEEDYDFVDAYMGEPFEPTLESVGDWKDEPEDEPNDEPNEQSEEDPNDKPEGPSDEPEEDPNDYPEDSNDEPNFPEEEPNDRPEDEPSDYWF